MDLKHITYKKPKSPSKLRALLVLSLTVALPLFLLNIFRSLPPSHELVNTVHSPPAENERKLDGLFVNTEDEVKTPMELKSFVQKTPTLCEDKWKTITTKKGDTLAKLFKKLGLSPKTLQEILKSNPHAKSMASIKPNQTVKFALRNNAFHKMIIPLNSTQSLSITRQENGYKTQVHSQKVSSHNHYVTATVKGSLYSTAKSMGISYKLIHQMAQVFNWEMDFSKDVREGDQFTIVYKALFVENKRIGTGEILAVTYRRHRGKTFKAFRYVNKKNEVDYYNEQGVSLKKAFTRYPVKFSHISSTFSLSRMHPVLKRKRPHKGVDLAAPIGTPIYAVGDGRIVSIGRHNGYGNMIKIAHNKTYRTVYAHMLKFQRGLSNGSRVKRGQIIGYVGQTGLATGPHCHFEFHINSHPKNPTTVDLPRAAPIPTNELAAFQSQTGTLLAQMKLYEEAALASNDGKNIITA